MDYFDITIIAYKMVARFQKKSILSQLRFFLCSQDRIRPLLRDEPGALVQGVVCRGALPHPGGAPGPLVPGLCPPHIRWSLLGLPQEGH